MASGGANKVVRIWDVATATPTSTLHVSRAHACMTPECQGEACLVALVAWQQ